MKNKKSKTNVILSLRKDLSSLFVAALVTVMLIDFLLADRVEFFRYGHETGLIIYQLAISYISAFIFYFLVVHLKQQKDKKNLYAYVAKKVNTIIGSGVTLFKDLALGAGIQLEGKFPNPQELDLILASNNPNEQARLFFAHTNSYATWLQYLNNLKLTSSESIDRIFKKMPFLETELIVLLAKIEDCNLFSTINILLHSRVGNSFSGFKVIFVSYLEAIKELDSFYQKKLKQYQ